MENYNFTVEAGDQTSDKIVSVAFVEELRPFMDNVDPQTTRSSCTKNNARPIKLDLEDDQNTKPETMINKMVNNTGSRYQILMLRSPLGRNFVGHKSQGQPKRDARFEDPERFVNQEPSQPQLWPATLHEILWKE